MNYELKLKASSGSSATEAAATEATATRTVAATRSITTAPVATTWSVTRSKASASSLSAPEGIDAVTDMEHGIGCDSIHLAVGPSVGTHRAREVRLLVEDVIPLQHDGEFLSLEETLRKLCVPDELIGIERLVAISPLAEHVEVGGEVGAPREGNPCISAIREVPCREVARCLQFVLSMGIGGIAVEGEVEPTVAKTERSRW